MTFVVYLDANLKSCEKVPGGYKACRLGPFLQHLVMKKADLEMRNCK